MGREPEELFNEKHNNDYSTNTNENVMPVARHEQAWVESLRNH
jgi:hypothetical protein